MAGGGDERRVGLVGSGGRLQCGERGRELGVFFGGRCTCVLGLGQIAYKKKIIRATSGALAPAAPDVASPLTQV